jgi:hypothetical protein
MTDVSTTLANGHTYSPPNLLDSDNLLTLDHHHSPNTASDDAHKDSELSHNNSDVDAEGSVDNDYNEIHVATNGNGAVSDAPSSTSRRTSSSSLRKRKSNEKDDDGFDEKQHMLNNPQLYGIRRSVSPAINLPGVPH